MTAQVAADLRAAAEVLRRDGWTQGDYEDGCGGKCAAAAINLVAGGSVGGFGEDARPAEAKAAFRRAFGVWPIEFNDAPGRTAEEVIAALLAAAAAAEAAS